MKKNIYQSTLALAGLFQTASLIQHIAHTGTAEETAFKACIQSTLAINPTDVTSVYGGIDNLKLGLKKLKELLGKNRKNFDEDIARYVISLLHLERKLNKNQGMLENIAQSIRQTINQANFFTCTHSNIIAKLADIYYSSLSTFNFRIQITGNPVYLKVNENVNRIRALLLSGIRAIILWRQAGGNRLQLFTRRKKIVAIANELLKHQEYSMTAET